MIRIIVIMMRRVCLENVFIDVLVCLVLGGEVLIRMRTISVRNRGLVSFFFLFCWGVRVEA